MTEAPLDMEQRAVQDTQRWLERAVIGLNLCPFARAVHVDGRIHYSVVLDGTHAGLLRQFEAELEALRRYDAEQRETTLLIAPGCLEDFLEFNGFLKNAQRLIRRAGLEGVFQLASFHPRYQFADSEPEEIGNFTNRSPYPTLQLLREASIERVVKTSAQAERIYRANMATLERLGSAGWAALEVGPSA